MNSDFSVVVIIIVSLIFSAFFSGMEIAFLSSNQLRFELEKKKRSLTSRILNIFYNDPEQYISTLLVGNNIALVIYGIKMAELLSPVFEQWVHNDMLVNVLQTIAATIIVLILLLGGMQLFCIGIIGEYVGKTFEQSKERPVYLEKEVLE